MADCEYCGKPAGLLRSIHKECAERRDKALSDIDLSFRNMMLVERAPKPEMFRAIVEKLATDARLDQSALRARILFGLRNSLDVVLSDLELSSAEMQRFQAIMNAFDLDTDALDQAGIRERLVKALVLKDLSEGKRSTRVSLGTSLPVVLKQGETIQWIFNNVELRQQRTRISYEGGSRGVSVRIMKGVSYRVGSYKGHRVENVEMTAIGHGDLAVSTNAIYFLCPPKSKRTTLGTIISVDTYDDGIVVTPSRGNPQIYMLSDPFFAANLILKLGAL
jgi:hypothetical protein